MSLLDRVITILSAGGHFQFLRPKRAPERQLHMETRQLGKSGLQVPILCFGTGTFGGGNEFFQAWGSTDAAEATRLIDICMSAGVNFFDTADIYSQGLSEQILGEAIQHLPRESVLISTKATFQFGDGPNN